MKKLRNFYFILGLFALAFALAAKHIPGVTITDFVLGFCHGLALTALVAGLVTSTIPYFYRKEKKETPATHDGKTSAANHEANRDAGAKTTGDGTHDSSVNRR